MIYLQHPLHGIKVAYTDAEIADDKKNGWREIQSEDNIQPEKPEDSVDINECPHCHKTFQRGLTMHMKYCKAVN